MKEQKRNQVIPGQLLSELSARWVSIERKNELTHMLDSMGIDVGKRLELLKMQQEIRNDLTTLALPTHSIPFQEKIGTEEARERLQSHGVDDALLKLLIKRERMTAGVDRMNLSREIWRLAVGQNVPIPVKHALRIKPGI